MQDITDFSESERKPAESVRLERRMRYIAYDACIFILSEK